VNGLILAGGEGSRLREDGVAVPKALVPLAGVPQIRRLAETFLGLGCSSLTCLVRDEVPEAGPVLASIPGPVRPVVAWCHTPSSLHTLVEGLRLTPPGAVFCSMVDAVMPPADWERAFRGVELELNRGADLVLVVTPFVDDEKPLWVERDGSGRVLRLGSEAGPAPCVTGGVYGLSPAIREEAARCLAEGHSRMRGFLQQAVERGQRIATIEIRRIIDLDRRRDLEMAEGWVRSGYQ
jgi:molybdopterin-guanine dinucleotide biosynthesis protein A